MTTIARRPHLNQNHVSHFAAVGDARQPIRDVKANGVMPTSENIAENKNVIINQVAERNAAAVSPADDTLKPSIRPPSVEQDRSKLQDQLKNLAITALTQQQVVMPALEQEQKSGFNIEDMVNSHQMQFAKLQDVFVNAFHKSRQADTAMVASLQKMSVSIANQSANHTRAAGKAAASQAFTSGAIGVAGAAVGLAKAGQSYKQGKLGISQQRDALEFQKQANALNSGLQQTPSSKMSQAELGSDRSIIAGGSALPMEHKSHLASVQASQHQNKATKLSTHATASTQIGNLSGQIAGSPFQIEQANQNAAATLSDNDKQITDGTRSKVDENKQREGQLMQQWMAMINGIMSEKANTAGAIAATRV